MSQSEHYEVTCIDDRGVALTKGKVYWAYNHGRLVRIPNNDDGKNQAYRPERFNETRNRRYPGRYTAH